MILRREERQLAEIGTLEFEVYGSGRLGRRTASRFKLRSDAIALHEHEILLLSAVGPETSVKALVAGLRSSGKDQQRIEYSASIGDIQTSNLLKCPAGYRSIAAAFPMVSGTSSAWPSGMVSCRS